MKKIKKNYKIIKNKDIEKNLKKENIPNYMILIIIKLIIF